MQRFIISYNNAFRSMHSQFTGSANAMLFTSGTALQYSILKIHALSNVQNICVDQHYR